MIIAFLQLKFRLVLLNGTVLGPKIKNAVLLVVAMSLLLRSASIPKQATDLINDMPAIANEQETTHLRLQFESLVTRKRRLVSH